MVEINSEAAQEPHDAKISDGDLKTFRRVKALGGLQLIGGIVLVGMVSWGLFTGEARGGAVILFALAALPLSAGYGLLKGTRSGLRLSVLNQLLQLVGFSNTWGFWNYAALGGVYITMGTLPTGDRGFGVSAYLDPGFQFGFGPGFGSDEVTISVDILAVFFLSVLYSLARLTKHN